MNRIDPPPHKDTFVKYAYDKSLINSHIWSNWFSVLFEVIATQLRKFTVKDTDTTTSATAGAATALPATPAGYLTVIIDGTERKIPYYDV